MRSRLALVVSGWVAAASLLHCGSDDSGTGGSDAGEDSGGGYDATVPDSGTDSRSPVDATGSDAPSDSTTSVDASDTGTNVDGGGDAGDASAIDASGGDDASDASDAADAADAADAGPPPVPCDASDQCGDAATAACCSGYCTNTATDTKNCGSCGNACTSTQFCTGLACDNAVVANVCDNPRATVVLDPYGTDDDAGLTVGQALVASCSPPPSLRIASQDDGGILDPTTSAPLGLPGDSFVAGGGSYGQRIVGYMDNAGQTPVMLGGDGINGWFQVRATMTDVVEVPVTELTATHDYFLVELSVDGASGSLCVFAIGMLGPGTTAASVYAQGELIPNRANYTDAWYVYEWTDSEDAGVPGTPDMSDTFTLIGHGP